MTRRNVVFITIIFSFFVITGCTNSLEKGTELRVETENPDAKEILTLDPDADILQFNNIIYQTNIDWVEELTLTKDKQIGEIKRKNETDTHFENEMANKLPVGAKIFTTKEDDMCLIVEAEGKTYTYYAIVEG